MTTKTQYEYTATSWPIHEQPIPPDPNNEWRLAHVVVEHRVEAVGPLAVSTPYQVTGIWELVWEEAL